MMWMAGFLNGDVESEWRYSGWCQSGVEVALNCQCGICRWLVFVLVGVLVCICFRDLLLDSVCFCCVLVVRGLIDLTWPANTLMSP